MPVGRRKVNITQQDHPVGMVGPQSAVALLTRAAAKAGLGKGQEGAIKQKYADQDAAYAKAHKRIKASSIRDKNRGKTAAVVMSRPKKQPTRMAKK